jgi:hypothetical protein
VTAVNRITALFGFIASIRKEQFVALPLMVSLAVIMSAELGQSPRERTHAEQNQFASSQDPQVGSALSSKPHRSTPAHGPARSRKSSAKIPQTTLHPRTDFFLGPTWTLADGIAGAFAGAVIARPPRASQASWIGAVLGMVSGITVTVMASIHIMPSRGVAMSFEHLRQIEDWVLYAERKLVADKFGSAIGFRTYTLLVNSAIQIENDRFDASRLGNRNCVSDTPDRPATKREAPLLHKLYRNRSCLSTQKQ